MKDKRVRVEVVLAVADRETAKYLCPACQRWLPSYHTGEARPPRITCMGVGHVLEWPA